MKKRAMLITLEGCEGCGKTTQSELLFKYLSAQGIKAVRTREPGGSVIAERIRKILLDPGNSISAVAELMLYEAARAQHLEEIIRPALKAGKTVICDRFTDATLAYQGFGRGLDLKMIRTLNDIATQGTVPDLTIYLDVSPRHGLARARKLNKDSFADGDRLENESLKFHMKVRKGYLALAKKYPSRIKVIKAGGTIEGSCERITAIVRERMKVF